MTGTLATMAAIVAAHTIRYLRQHGTLRNVFRPMTDKELHR